jgi:8-oxo-dGTP pyrophosphatase MutT (NUDIX family)
LVVFVPEYRGRLSDVAADEPTDWRADALGIADVAMFWWPDDEDRRLMLTSLAAWNDSQRVVHGAPSHAPHSRHLVRYAGSHGISTATTLSGTVRAALGKIGTGARRTGGEREVPLPVWRTESFQHWYSAQISAGNRLDGARQVWTFGAGPHQPLIYWALHVRVFVSSENRVKSNEVVISRPDIFVVALYQRGATLDESIVVLVREFRSTAATSDGFVHELPGGSGAFGADALGQAVRETEEETGLVVDVRRIRAHGRRQLAATVSAHRAHLFTAELTNDELAWLRATQAMPHGAGDTERTWAEVTTFGEIRRNRLVDWATLGMIAEAVFDRNSPPRA